MTNNTVTLTLGCGHRVLVHIDSVIAGGFFHCWACKASCGWVSLNEPGTGHWFYCEHCRYKRHYGIATLTCEITALRHARNKPGHSVIVMHNEARVCTYTHNPTCLDECPF